MHPPLLCVTFPAPWSIPILHSLQQLLPCTGMCHRRYRYNLIHFRPLHGGANEQALEMLEGIGEIEKIPQFLEDVKNKKKKLMGFGHRIYKSYDPRANIIKKVANKVFDVCGQDVKLKKLWDLAVELEKQALSNEYFVQRKLFPNIDFYSGLIYRAMGFPPDMYPVLFCIPRAAGWLAHWYGISASRMLILLGWKPCKSPTFVFSDLCKCTLATRKRYSSH